MSTSHRMVSVLAEPHGGVFDIWSLKAFLNVCISQLKFRQNRICVRIDSEIKNETYVYISMYLELNR